MSEALSLAEIDGQHVELLPARTVLSSYSSGFFYPNIEDANINVNVNENENTATATATISDEVDDGTAPGPLDALLP